MMKGDPTFLMDHQGRPRFITSQGVYFWCITCTDGEECYVAAPVFDEALQMIREAKPKGISNIESVRLMPSSHVFPRHPATHVSKPDKPVTVSQLVRRWGGKGITGNDL